MTFPLHVYHSGAPALAPQERKKASATLFPAALFGGERDSDGRDRRGENSLNRLCRWCGRAWGRDVEGGDGGDG